MGASTSGMSCCCTDVRRKPLAKSVRPLLANLETEFHKFASGDGKRLTRDDLMKMWRSAVEKEVGHIHEDDEDLMEASLNYYFNQMDLDQKGAVDIDKFILYMMGATEDRGPLRSMRQHINKAIAKDENVLHSLISQFRKWDRNGDGYVTKEEMEQYLEEVAHVGDQDVKATQQIKDLIFQEADVDGDGKIDLWEAMAHCLGRRKKPVEILLYDVSKGVMDALGPTVLGAKLRAVHSGVLVFDDEYWYGGKIYRTAPPCTSYFGTPMEAPWGSPLEKSQYKPELPVVHCGYTFLTAGEFTSWVKKKAPEYTRDKYDLLTHSCNHFANECLQFLTGHELPQQIFDLQKTLLQSETVQKLRPFLNRYLACFADAEKKITDDGFSTDYMPHIYRADSQAILHDVLGPGDIVIINGEFVEGINGEVVATIVAEDLADETLELRYFDVKLCTVSTISGVPLKAVRRDVDAEKSSQLTTTSSRRSQATTASLRRSAVSAQSSSKSTPSK